MLFIVTILFALAALMGIAMLVLHLRKRVVCLCYALTHLVLAAMGLAAFITTVAQHGATGLLGQSLTLFCIAALGGFVMLALRVRAKAPPATLMLIHGLLAVAAFVILLTQLPGA